MQDERFEWHDRKARTNLRDHGVTFGEASRVFDDLRAVDSFDDSMDYDEERSIVIGLAGSRLLVVIYTMRDERIRIISAREPGTHEQKRYFDQGR